MGCRSLRDEQYAGHYERRDDRGGERPAHVEAACGDRLIEEIADGGAERAGEDERRPEERRGRDACAVIGDGDQDEQRTEEQRAATVAKPRVRSPVAERSTEGL